MASNGPKVILITGGIGAGKSSLLARVAHDMRRSWRICGCVSRGEWRQTGEPAARYWLRSLPDGAECLWAARGQDGEGFRFHAESLARVEEQMRAGLGTGPELVFLDELGRLELRGDGLAPVAREALLSGASVRWRAHSARGQLSAACRVLYTQRCRARRRFQKQLSLQAHQVIHR